MPTLFFAGVVVVGFYSVLMVKRAWCTQKQNHWVVDVCCVNLSISIRLWCIGTGTGYGYRYGYDAGSSAFATLILTPTLTLPLPLWLRPETVICTNFGSIYGTNTVWGSQNAQSSKPMWKCVIKADFITFRLASSLTTNC